MALQKGLVGHFTMNSEDTDNGMIRDRSAYDNHGTLNGGVSNGGYAPSGSAMTFDGTDDYIDIPNDLFSGKNAATTTAWVKPKSLSSDAGLIQQEDSWYFQLTSGNELLIAPHGDPGVSGGNLSTGKWHFVVFSWKGNDFYKGYVDGNLVINQSSSVGSLNNSSYEASIGWRDNQNYYLDGDISEVRLYNRVLSQSEITQLYNQRSTRAHKMQRVPVAQQDLVAHYPFASSGATDQSGNGFDGTVKNSPNYLPRGQNGSGAYDFGTSERIDVQNIGDEISSIAFTISYWINYDNFIDYNVAYGSNPFWTEPWRSGSQGVSWRFRDQSGSNHKQETSYFLQETGKWYLITYVWNGEEMIVYVDGDQKDVQNEGNVSPDINSTNYINSYRGSGNGIDGKISDVRIYNRALSKYEVKRLYQSEGNVFGGRIRRTVYQGNDVVVEEDQYGTWLLVMNYEHYRNEDPAISRASSFPQMPNGVPNISDVDSFGTSGEMKHVDNISQYGVTDVSAVRLEGLHKDHNRKMNYFTENQNVIDAIVDDSTKANASDLKDQTTKYDDHTTNLPDAGNNETNTRTAHIFGYEFPMFLSGTYHWSIGEGRWEIDNQSTNTAIYRVWVRI